MPKPNHLPNVTMTLTNRPTESRISPMSGRTIQINSSVDQKPSSNGDMGTERHVGKAEGANLDVETNRSYLDRNGSQ